MFEEQYRKRMDEVALDEGQRARLLEMMTETAPRRRKVYRTAITAAAVCAVLTVSAVAAPAVGRVLQYFEENRNSMYQTYAPVYGTLSTALEQSVTDSGITMTLEAVTQDSSYLTVFYNVKNTDGSALALSGREGVPENWKARYSAGWLEVLVDGETVEKGVDDLEAYLSDNGTLRVMERIGLKQEIADGAQVLLRTNWLLHTEGDWQFSFTADSQELAGEQRVYTPGTQISWPGASAVVERVSLAPTGNLLVLGQIEETETPMEGFVLRDDQGNYLPVEMGTDGYFSFSGCGTDVTSLTLIPMSLAEEVTGCTEPVAIDALPLEEPGENGLILVSLDVGADRTVAVYETKGAVFTTGGGGIRLLDASGQKLELAPEGKDVYMDCHLEANTGRIYETYYYPYAEIDVPAAAKQVCFGLSNVYTLHEELAVTIPLTAD